MYAVEIYAAVRLFVFVEGRSRRRQCVRPEPCHDFEDVPVFGASGLCAVEAAGRALPFEDWTSIFRSEWLTGALLDRITHHVHILELNGDRYRLKQSKNRRRTGRDPGGDEAPPPSETVDPQTGEVSP